MGENTPTIDRVTLLRNQATADRNKSRNRVSSVVCRAHIAAFLNSDESIEDHVDETLFGVNANPTAVVARLRTLLKQDKQDELCWPMKTENGVSLIRLV